MEVFLGVIVYLVVGFVVMGTVMKLRPDLVDPKVNEYNPPPILFMLAWPAVIVVGLVLGGAHAAENVAKKVFRIK